MQQRLDGHSEVYSQIDQPNSDHAVPEDMKSAFHQLDKSAFSQFDMISQYTYYMEQKKQTKDEKSKKLSEFKQK